MANVSTGDEFSTVIGADAHFKGELSFQGGVRVDGKFEGSIDTSGKVLVSKTGKMKAEIKAGSITLEGEVTGNLVAEDRVELNASGKLTGDIHAAKLLVKEGAAFVGRCEVGALASKAKPKTTAPGDPMRAIADAAGGRK